MDDGRSLLPASVGRWTWFYSQISVLGSRYLNKKQGGEIMQEGFTVWFTGWSGSGKTTLAKALENELKKRGIRNVQRLDGDIVRKDLTRDLGFTKEDRDENIRRVTFVADLLSNNGVATLVSFISPYIEARDNARKRCRNFVEVYVKCSKEELIKRDVKGLYKKALAGEIENFTGISDPYEEPPNPEVVVETDKKNIEECLEKIISVLEEREFIPIGDAAIQEDEDRGSN
jgi:adenylyl-sulfate kinase